MKVLLVGTNVEVREHRRRTLCECGYDAVAVSPDEADPYIADSNISCLVLGSSIGERMAELLASKFTATAENRFVVRIVEEPAASNYPYAHFVANPRSPAALLAAVKAIVIRLRQSTQG